MRQFGAYLANLRSSAKISLDALGQLVGTSKSTLSRLENNEIPQPFKGKMRQLVIDLAEIICTSRKETERYLELAGIEKALLAEAEEIQLGFTPFITPGSSEETSDLERLERIYEQRLQHLAVQESKLGASNSPQNLKLKIQEYANTQKEIQTRLDKLLNRQRLPKSDIVQEVPIHHATALTGRLTVGYQYGEGLNDMTLSKDLYSLASSNARWLMQLADIECFAVDDCVILTNSRDFEGWEPHEIKTFLLSLPLPIPDDLEKLRQEKLPSIEKDYFNSPHYRLLSFTPSFGELDHLEVKLAPLGFYDYYSITPFFDEPLLNTLDGSKVSIRQKYGNTALIYTSTDRGTSLIPTPVSIQCVLVTKEQHIVLMQRSFSVAFYPNHWSASFEETMNAPTFDKKRVMENPGDSDFFAGTFRGLNEEFAIPSSAVESIKVLSLNVEYLTLSVDAIVVIKVDLTDEDIKQKWLLKARHKAEASNFDVLSTDLHAVVEKLFSRTLWHPTSRMRLIQYLFHTYGIDEVEKAIKQRQG